MKKETVCLHGGYKPENGQARALPIYQSTTFRYENADEVARLFDLTQGGFFYSRLGNPTVDAVEKKLAMLEGGVGALCTSSGQAANMLAVLNIANAGDHVISTTNIYGGTFNLFNTTLRKLGIDTTFINPDMTDQDIEKLIRPNTRLIFGETLANPALTVLDLERFANLAHRHNLPFIVDNTFATPILCRPFEYGVDVVVHSSTKYLDGHAIQVGGAIIDSGKFDWTNGKFPEFTEPDPSYHGLVYSEAFGNLAYIVKARVQLMRDMGCCQSAQGAFYTNLGLETLPLRMRAHSDNALALARWLSTHEKISSVSYPALPGDSSYELALKYLPDGASGVISFTIKGGKKEAIKFINSLKLVSLEVHVADIRSCILHPASSTHRQLTNEQLEQAGVSPGLMRLSVGLENIEDIIEDIEQALNA